MQKNAGRRTRLWVGRQTAPFLGSEKRQKRVSALMRLQSNTRGRRPPRTLPDFSVLVVRALGHALSASEAAQYLVRMQSGGVEVLGAFHRPPPETAEPAGPRPEREATITVGYVFTEKKKRSLLSPEFLSAAK